MSIEELLNDLNNQTGLFENFDYTDRFEAQKEADQRVQDTEVVPEV